MSKVKEAVSHTAASAAQAVNIKQSICKAAGLSKEDWSNVLFESGCAWAEMSAPTMSIAQAWLTEPKFGFWADWLMSFIRDDEWLLEHKVSLNPERYTEIKFDFINTLIDEKNKY